MTLYHIVNKYCFLMESRIIKDSKNVLNFKMPFGMRIWCKVIFENYTQYFMVLRIITQIALNIIISLSLPLPHTHTHTVYFPVISKGYFINFQFFLNHS